MPVIALAAVLIAWALVSARAARFSVTVPVALMLAGLLIAGTDGVGAAVDTTSVRHALEAALALILFTDAVELRPRGLRIAGHLPARLLLIAFPLTVLAGYLTGILLYPDASGWVVGLIAAAVAASDASLAASLLTGDRVPSPVRAAVNIESGFNDGLAAPLVLFFLSGAVTVDLQFPSLLATALHQGLVALAVGSTVGFGAGWLLRAARTLGWSGARSERIAYVAVAALAFGGAYALHGNVLIAAFAAGLGVRAADRDLPRRQLQLSHDVVLLMSAAVWFAFGTILPGALGRLTWTAVAYAALSLTLVRMIPVALSLTGVRRPRRDKLLLAWLGPTGLPTVILGLLALEQLTGSAADLVAVLIATTVVASVLAHGLTAGPIARWLSRLDDPDPAIRP
jgi:NhaP-type Na+/H+ or K+/H+ antiporter